MKDTLRDCIKRSQRFYRNIYLDLLPLRKRRGLPPSRVSFPASQEVASLRNCFPDRAYTASTGLTFRKPCGSFSVCSRQERGSCSWQKKERGTLVQHASAFTQANDLAWNLQTLFRCQGTKTRIPEKRNDVKRQSACRQG